jgi:lipopolysaccharide/colanic/teichoic acid biosynthesis glycosyltransferase
MLLPGNWAEVRSAPEILATLGSDQALERLPFMPEMLQYCGRRFRVTLRAERTCVHPPEVPFRRLDGCVVLEGLRCDGAQHGQCMLGCMFLWKEAWLRPVDAPGSVPRTHPVEAGETTRHPQPGQSPPALRATRGPDAEVFFCQATELPKATVPGHALWRPGQYVGMVRRGTYAPTELMGMFTRIGIRRIRQVVRSLDPRSRGVLPADGGPLRLQPGEWVQVKNLSDIRRTLDEKGTHRGLAFGGDMADQCGRRMRVLKHVDRIIDEANGRLRTVRDTVVLEDSICDRYFGCARGMPFLWREAWLTRVQADAAPARGQPVGPPAGRSADPPASSRERTETGLRRMALAVKRGSDLAGAATLAVLLSPVLLWTAVGVVITQGWPILFRHERPGLREQPFTLLKFRTMRAPRPGEVWYQTDDQRITPLGRFLRSSSIDELPELWNVLRGDMSLVGPRPLLTEYLDKYTPEERRRHDMRPGITGWAAVNGRHATKFRDRLKLDVWYIDHWSLGLDLKILGMTAAQVLRRQDVSATQNLAEVGFPLPGVGEEPMHTGDTDDRDATEPRAGTVLGGEPLGAEHAEDAP